MKALGIKPGDEVITTAHSWISTSETITQAGGKVVFVDTEPDYFTIDPQKSKKELHLVLLELSRFIYTDKWLTWLKFKRLPKK